jgi:hypothetical protein
MNLMILVFSASYISSEATRHKVVGWIHPASVEFRDVFCGYSGEPVEFIKSVS